MTTSDQTLRNLDGVPHVESPEVRAQAAEDAKWRIVRCLVWVSIIGTFLAFWVALIIGALKLGGVV